MKNNVRVVSAFVPLNVRHMDAAAYHKLGYQMLDATNGRSHFFDNFPLEECWSYKELVGLSPATTTPEDRYATPHDHVLSHIVQHTRTEWAFRAAKAHPDLDVVIWLDLGILKQGKWNGNPVLPQDVADLCDKVERYQFNDIPFPGIEERKPIDPHGNNWRFCGSTHIWPVKWLKQIDFSYRYELRKFVETYECVPLDLAIWPAVEEKSGLPFKWYKAEYDATQLRNFPCASS